jgi:transmembrane sensor
MNCLVVVLNENKTNFSPNQTQNPPPEAHEKMELDAHIALIIKQLSGEITAIEAAQLQKWKAADTQNRQSAEAIERIWLATENLAEISFPLDLESEFSRLESHISDDSAKIIPLKPKQNWFKYAVAASILTVASIGIWQFFSQNKAELVAGKTDNKTEITLADGSHIFINKHSTLRYPSEFSGNERRVQLIGEAFFDIAKNATKPFYVETDFARIRVVGTHFNVKTGADRVQIDVEEGVVEVEGGGAKTQLRAGEGVILYKNGAKVQPTGFQQNAAAWANGELFFKNKILTDVCTDLGHFYDVEIEIENQALLFKTFSWTQPKDLNLNKALNIVSATFGASVEKISEKKYRIVGGH